MPPTETIIESRSGWQLLDIRELWRSRELLYFLVWRDIKLRYKQTVLGAAWAVLQPFAGMVLFSLFLARLLADSTTHYPLFVFAGLLPWTFFANSVSSASLSVVGNHNLITKVYFPRLLIPIGSVAAGLVDFLVAFGMLVILMAYYAVWPSWSLLLAPLVILFLVLAASGMGTLLSALTVAYRDFRYVVPFMVQLWMFATPSIYMQAETVIDSSWQWWLPLNPAHGLIGAFRATMLGGSVDLYALGVSSVVSLALFLTGCFYFRQVERNFADII